MTKRDPNQLSLDDQIEEPTPELDQADVAYKNRRTGDIVYGSEIDALVGGGQFNYPMAMARLGVTHDDIVDEHGDYTTRSPEKRKRYSSKQTKVCVDLGTRASLLLGAMEKYEFAGGTEQRVRALQEADASDEEIDRELYLQHINKNAADEDYLKAVGRSVLPRKIIDIPLRLELREDYEDFLDLSTNPGRKEERDRLSEVLSRQKSSS